MTAQEEADKAFADLTRQAPVSQGSPEADAAFAQLTGGNARQAAPNEPKSWWQNLPAAAATQYTDTYLGLKQRGNEWMAGEQQKPGGQWLLDKMGYDPAAIRQSLQDELTAKRSTDKPVIDAPGGTTGRVLASASMAAPTMFLPGGATLGGAMLAGGAMGALEPTSTDESVLQNMGVGGLGGAAGYGIGKGLGALASGWLARNAAKAAQQDTPLRQTINAAQDAGYKFDPTAVNPTITNRVLSGVAGKTNLAQRASIENQRITNELAAVEIGLDKSTNLTPEAIAAAKQVPAKVYDQMRGLGEVTASPNYGKSLDAITQKYAGASKSFAMDNPIAPVVEPFKVPSFDSSAAVDAISILREEASQAFRQGNTSLGKAKRAIASVLEDELGNAKTAPPDLLDAFRQARTTFAKIHTVEKSLNEASGNVNATKIGAEFAKGKPLSGGLETIGRTQQGFPKSLATQRGDAMPGISPFDAMTGVISAGASGNPAWLGTALGRPLLQNALLSGPAQRLLTNPGMPSNRIPDLLGNEQLRKLMQGGLLGYAPQTSQ